MKTSVRYFLSFLLLMCASTSQIDKNSKRFTLNGEIIGQDTGTIILSYAPDLKWVYNTTYIKNGKFLFSGLIAEPTQAQIIGDNELNSTDLYIEPGRMYITLTKNKFKDFKMTGSKTQDELNQLNLMVKPINKKLSILNKKHNQINDSIMSSRNRAELIKLQKEAKEIENQSSSLRKEINSTYLSFVLNNPQSYVTPYYLDILALNGVIPYDSLKSIFYGLQINIQNSIIGKKIQDEIRKKDNIIVGATVPDFTAKDLNNKTITLSQFKNKNVVIMDFWASWCEGCRAGFPHLKNLYHKYNSQGLDIIAFSYLDVNKETWVSAINHDSINMWHNVATIFRDGDTINKGIAENYPLPGIPLTILMGKDGKVLCSWRGYSKEYEESLEKKLIEIFKY